MLSSNQERQFRRIYNDYYPVIVRAIYSRVGNMEDAEDICHEVFVSCYRKFGEIENFRSWLFGAVRFAVSNFYRSRGNLEVDQSDLDLENDPGLAFENGARDVRIILAEAIGKSEHYRDERERVLFELVALSGFTYEQAARQLGYSKRQAVYRYQLVSRRIVDYLKSRGISSPEDLL